MDGFSFLLATLTMDERMAFIQHLKVLTRRRSKDSKEKRDKKIIYRYTITVVQTSVFF